MLGMVVKEIKKDEPRVDRFILENTKSKEGVYVVVDIDKPFNPEGFVNFLVIDKDIRRFSNAIIPGECADSGGLIDYVSKRDAKSKLLNSMANKAIDVPTKKILNTVYLSFCINGQSVEKAKGTESELVDYYVKKGLDFYRDIKSKAEATLSLKKYKDYCPEIVNSLKEAESEDRLKEIDLIEDYIRDNLKSIMDFAKNKGLTPTGILKIFFTSSSEKIDDSLSAYDREEEFYLYRCLLNGDGINILNGKLVGTTIYGFNNNEKKIGIQPTSMNIDLIKQLTFEEAKYYRKAFMLFEVITENNNGRAFGLDVVSDKFQFADETAKAVKENISIDDFTKNVANKGLIFKFNNKEKYIEFAEANFHATKKRNSIGRKQVKLKNYFGDKECFFVKDKEDAKEESIRLTEPTVKELLARLGFCAVTNLNKYSDYRAFAPINANLAREMSFIHTKYINLISDFLFAETVNRNLAKKVIGKYTEECIDSYISNAWEEGYSLAKLKQLLNYRLNLIDEFKIEGKDLEMAEKYKELEEKIIRVVDEGEDLDCSNDIEYFYALGQLVFYVEYQAMQLTEFTPFKEYASKRTVADLIKHLITRIDLYSYAINPCGRAFKSIANKVLLVGQDDRKVKDNLAAFYGGIFANNVLLRPNQKNSTTETEIENKEESR